MPIILSSAEYFRRFLLFRYATIALVLVALGFYVWGNPDTTVTTVITTTAMIALVTLITFEYLQKPAYLEVTHTKDKLSIDLFVPDNRYLYFFRTRNISTIEIPKTTWIDLSIQPGIISLLDKGCLIISDAKGNRSTKSFDLSWASEQDRKTTIQTFQEHNQQPR